MALLSKCYVSSNVAICPELVNAFVQVMQMRHSLSGRLGQMGTERTCEPAISSTLSLRSTSCPCSCGRPGASLALLAQLQAAIGMRKVRSWKSRCRLFSVKLNPLDQSRPGPSMRLSFRSAAVGTCEQQLAGILVQTGALRSWREGPSTSRTAWWWGFVGCFPSENWSAIIPPHLVARTTLMQYVLHILVQQKGAILGTWVHARQFGFGALMNCHGSRWPSGMPTQHPFLRSLMRKGPESSNPALCCSSVCGRWKGQNVIRSVSACHRPECSMFVAPCRPRKWQGEHDLIQVLSLRWRRKSKSK